MNRILLVDCADHKGLIHKATGVLYRHGCNIVSNHEFVDEPADRFFMRTEFSGSCAAAELQSELLNELPEGALVRLSDQTPPRIVILVTKEHHCLAELLIRHTFGELGAGILAVVGTRPALEDLTTRFGIAFHCIQASGISREDHEEAIQQTIDAYRPDYLVLAKFMRILSPAFVKRYSSRIINIHHSFLPAFAGAKPYQQAWERGVKIIGATAHFVTDLLDQGPIITQRVIPVDHTHSPKDMAQAGRDIEKLVLARALKLVFEDRVFLCGNRTIIFD